VIVRSATSGLVKHPCGHIDGEHGVPEVVHDHRHRLEPNLLSIGNIAGHVVERPGQSAQFIFMHDRRPDGEVALAEGFGRAGCIQHRAYDPSRESRGAAQ
jgi:hypothetical protein